MQIVEHEDKTSTVYLNTYCDVREMLIDYLHKKNIDNVSIINVKFLDDTYCEELINKISCVIKPVDK